MSESFLSHQHHVVSCPNPPRRGITNAPPRPDGPQHVLRLLAKAGYEISFTRYFYQTQPLRSTPKEIWADIRALERESEGLLGEIFNPEGVI